jgi:hypothetical protein
MGLKWFPPGAGRQLPDHDPGVDLTLGTRAQLRANLVLKNNQV